LSIKQIVFETSHYLQETEFKKSAVANEKNLYQVYLRSTFTVTMKPHFLKQLYMLQ